MSIEKKATQALSIAALLLLSHCTESTDAVQDVGSQTSPLTGTYVGCYTDDANRALPVSLGSGRDVQGCIDAARARGLAYAGLQYYGECWGGGAAGYTKTAESECNTPCSANSSQTCGGGWRNSIYSTAVAPPVPSGSTYVGCFTDAANRALPVSLGSGFDVAACVSAVRSRGLKYAGLQWYGECFGGGTLGYAQTAESECSTPCSANPAESCGGGWRNSIYDTGAATTPPPPPAPASGRIKLISWNMHNSQNPSGQTAALGPKNADVIFLQEVSAGTADAYLDGMNAYERNVSGSSKVWVKSLDGALLTWRPVIGSIEVKDIGQNSWPDNYSWTNNPHRTGTRATVDINGTAVNFFGTHLDYNPNGNMTNHIENRTRFLQWVDTFPGRKMVGGDLNAWTWGPSGSEGDEQRITISQFSSRGTDVCVQLRGVDSCNSNGGTMSNGWTPDHIFRSGGLATVSYTVVQQPSLSDHYMIVVEADLQ